MPQIALHFANSLHQVIQAELADCDLCRAGLDSHTAAQSDMGAVLKLLLDVEVEGEEDPSSDQVDKGFSKHPVVAALQFREPKSGLTLLGQAMTWGYDGAIPPLLDAVR